MTLCYRTVLRKGPSVTVTGESVAKECVAMANAVEFKGNASTNHTTLDVGIALCTFSVAAILLGVPGNILIIRAVRNRKSMQNARNHFIVSLACSDIISLLVFVPFASLNTGHVLRDMPEVVCKTLMPTVYFLLVISVCSHVAIALERRRAIVFPLLPKPSPRRIKTFIAIIWLVPTLIIAPILYQTSQVSLGYCSTFSLLNEPKEVYMKGVAITATASIFVIPLGVLVWSYRQIIRTLKQNTVSIKELVNTNAAVALRLKNQRKVVNCLITLVCAFVALNFPNYLAAIIIVFTKTLDSYIIFTFGVVSLCIHFMLYTLNPIILYVSSTEYRLAFNETFNMWKNFFCRIYE